MVIVESRNLSKTYGNNLNNKTNAVQDISLTINKGEFVAIMGPSGSGKSTFINMLSGILKPTSGEVIIDGDSIAAMSNDEMAEFRRKKLGFVFQDFMLKQVKDNYGKWKRVPRETYHPFRTYKAKYEQVNKQIDNDVKVKGWTHNPFLLVTAPIGTDEYKDNIFEWEITFCWPVEMDKLYAQNNYATVNIQAETMTPGGKVVAERPVHVYLTKELFTRTGNYGYYSFRYQSKCGAGNRERLHIWSDQYICISSLYVELKEVTQKRTEQLTQQVDIQSLKEI